MSLRRAHTSAKAQQSSLINLSLYLNLDLDPEPMDMGKNVTSLVGEKINRSVSFQKQFPELIQRF